jgi:predicted metal-dependent phosphoesterase TrpH
MEKLIDMHIHTVYSDGEKTPIEIVHMAKENNVSTFSITDHDTILGVQELLKNYNEPNLRFISGIELTAKINKGRLHILGYGIDPYNKKLNESLVFLKENSIKRVREMVGYIRDRFNITFNDQDLEKMYNSVGNIGRPDIAKLCLKYGYVSNTQEAFNKYLIEAYDHLRKSTLKLTDYECINLILETGGIPVLAHPISLEKDNYDLNNYILKLMKYGLEGIEVYHSSQDEEYSNQLKKIANQYNLLISGGSDYHGEIIKPDVMLGSGKNGNVKIKQLSILGKV